MEKFITIIQLWGSIFCLLLGIFIVIYPDQTKLILNVEETVDKNIFLILGISTAIFGLFILLFYVLKLF